MTKPRYKLTAYPIPPITDRLGSGWAKEQPQPNELTFAFDTGHGLNVAMSEVTFKKLANYSCSFPSGTYAGKMWRQGPNWLLWYELDPNDSNFLITQSARIQVVK